MANATNAFGLRPVRYMNGSPWTGQARHYYVPSTDNTALGIGDPVTIVGDSNDNEVVCLGGRFPPGTLSEVTRSTLADGNYITGVVVGVEAVSRDSTIYREASTERVVLVVDDPNVIFQVRDDGGGALTADTVGLNAILITGTLNTTTGLSGMKLDAGTGTAPAADASYMLQIIALSNIPDNAISVGAVWDVRMNLHSYSTTTDGALGVA